MMTPPPSPPPEDHKFSTRGVSPQVPQVFLYAVSNIGRGGSILHPEPRGYLHPTIHYTTWSK
jgi:hypothetical protein